MRMWTKHAINLSTTESSEAYQSCDSSNSTSHSRSYGVAFAEKGGIKQVAAHQFKIDCKASKRVVFAKGETDGTEKNGEDGSQYQLLANVGCPNCLVDVVAPDNAGEQDSR